MIRALRNLKTLHFNGLILTKVYSVSAKKVQRNYVWFHSRLMQSLKENWLMLPKIDVRNLANFHQSTWKSPSWDLDGILLSKVENLWAWNLRESMYHDNKEWCKNWRGIYLSVQNWLEEFDKFWSKHSKFSKICTLMGFFWPKYVMLELKKSIGELCLMALNIDGTLERKLACAFKNDMKNLTNFHQCTFESLKIGTLMRSFYPK